VRSQLERATEGVALLQRGIADALELGLGTRTVFNKTWLALAQTVQGVLDDAVQTLEQAVKENTDDPVALLMALLLRGELWLRKDQSRAAEDDFRHALTHARSMGAKMLELKVITSLARLLDNQGRRVDARTMLAGIYNWFSEGFDLLELKEAKALLDELS
jgi:tetratricopeptide (TPR) repeat protein